MQQLTGSGKIVNPAQIITGYEVLRGAMMKRILIFSTLLLSLLFLFAGCGDSASAIKTPANSSTLNGVTATLENVEISKVPNGSSVFQPTVSITNNSDKGIMQVKYLLTVYDKNGNELMSVSLTCSRESQPIGKGETVDANSHGFQQVLENDAASMGIEVTEILTEDELPPLHVPEAGEYLYQALNDEKINNIQYEEIETFVVGIDQGGYLREASFQTSEEIETAVDLFCKIRVGEDTGEMVTDNYNYIQIIWDDGSSSNISLNLYNLELNLYGNWHSFELENLSDLWSYATDNAVEVER